MNIMDWIAQLQQHQQDQQMQVPQQQQPTTQQAPQQQQMQQIQMPPQQTNNAMGQGGDSPFQQILGAIQGAPGQPGANNGKQSVFKSLLSMFI